MTEQLWTITAIADGAVVKDCSVTSGPDVLPWDSGEPFDQALHMATPIAARPKKDVEIWDGGGWVTSPSLIRDQRWEAAKAYREVRRNASLAVFGVFPSRAVTVKMDIESRLTISGAVTTATIFNASGLPFAFTFDDEMGEEATVNADQTIALGLGVAIYSGLCDARLRAVRIELDAALEAGASAATIAAIDVTTGYPSTGTE